MDEISVYVATESYSVDQAQTAAGSQHTPATCCKEILQPRSSDRVSLVQPAKDTNLRDQQRIRNDLDKAASVTFCPLITHFSSTFFCFPSDGGPFSFTFCSATAFCFCFLPVGISTHCNAGLLTLNPVADLPSFLPSCFAALAGAYLLAIVPPL